MAQTAYETIERLLEAVLERTDDKEASFKLRTALQLLVHLETDHERAVQALESADVDDDLRERLRSLGYLE